MAFSGIYLTEIQKVLRNTTASDDNESHFHNSSGIFTQEGDAANNTSTNGGDSSAENSDQVDHNSNEYTQAQYPGILDSDLTSLTSGQKKFFIATVCILCTISIVGNVSTLVVNFRRKIRPFFRACLISLALSDLMNTVFLSTAYLSQFMVEYVQIWSLGSLMCSFVPFATTVAILASSMTLVGIAVDRYYAVMRAVIGFWQPSAISCIVGMVCIWLASIGIACPVFNIYDIMPVYILTEEHPAGDANRHLASPGVTNNAVTTTKTPWEEEASQENLSYTLVREQRLVDMCVSDQDNVTLYYAIVFVIIFIPCIGAFFWFNTIIARKLWKRRHSVTITKNMSKRSKLKIKRAKQLQQQQRMKLQISQQAAASANSGNSSQPQYQSCSCRLGHSSSTMPSSLTAAMGGTKTPGKAPEAAQPPTNISGTRNSREARHLRMFTIILLMMAVFVFLRLPAWIFLLMRMYGSYGKPRDWIIYFVFGVLNLASSVLNPLFYTFLTETIQYVLRLKAKTSALLCTDCSWLGGFWCCHSNGRATSDAECATVSDAEEPHFALSCCENFCGCSGFLRATWQCQQPQQLKRTHQPQQKSPSLQMANETSGNKQDNTQNDPEVIFSNDKDEGVDCSEELDEDDNCDFNGYNHRIYTIYPASLVSTSSQ
ncbi:5-hydroxytryptamine receptor 1 [Musca domestica]|uniref:5-hydroxytryptamine receptor 1 n=1 Tax=Musca domestica TaxID=7370 RepID=A0ABM3V1H7_MUSDO|nr:5-hydroxytryptamine receptor 1 [Musca domestica]XP_058979638.1 5-hydroxytryptamine receptor 1 [Musca domestica]